jgi:type II secretory ATPase GspE/PulE/Tfp pilus assembly ATPase PilB-like protein
MKCKTCKEEVEKKPIIRNGVTRFVDAKGQLWNGKVCGDCYRLYNKERMKVTRSNKIAVSET